MKMKWYSDEGGNKWMDCNLLEIAFLQFESDQVAFMRNAMFVDPKEWLDTICGQYDYTDELPESELYYTTYQKLDPISRWNMYEGKDYIVTVDNLDNISIYKKLKGKMVYE